LESKNENASICRLFVLRGSTPGLDGEEGKGERNGDWIGVTTRLLLLSLRSAARWSVMAPSRYCVKGLPKERKLGGLLIAA
jgi:hypothetical protein